MRNQRASRGLGVLLVALLVAACGDSTTDEAALVVGGDFASQPTSSLTVPATTTTTTAPPATSTTPTTATRAATTTTAAAAAPAAAGPTTTVARPNRRVNEQAWTPMLSAGGVVLRHPSSRVERIGFHESNIDGAQPLEALPTATDPIVLQARSRDTNGRGAADVVVDPDTEIRSPVTGKVLYSGTYVLYCKYSDDFVIIEPDAHPGWEVKVLHIDGVQVRPGQRVTAGETVLAPRPTRLPFASQVEEVSATPPWPHVHVEIIDPSIPDRPSTGGC